jgi:hypothetical protein
MGGLRPGLPRTTPRRREGEGEVEWWQRAQGAVWDHEAAQERTRVMLGAIGNRVDDLRRVWTERREHSVRELDRAISEAPARALGGCEENPGPLARVARAVELLGRSLEARRWPAAARAVRRIRSGLRAAERVADLAIVCLGDPDDVPPRPRRSGKLLLRSEWYERRIDGFGDLSADVHACGQSVRWIRCLEADCGAIWCVPEWCDESIACPDCRARKLVTDRQEVSDELARAEAALVGSAFRRRFLVLTVPAVGQLEDRMVVAQRARPIWTAEIARYLRELGHERHAVRHLETGETESVAGWWWHARLEVTEGADHEGHWHWNVLALSPWLPHALVSVVWGQAIERAGSKALRRPLAEVLDELGKPRGRPESREARRSREVHRARGYDDPAVARIGAATEIPWLGNGRPPRRRVGEAAIDYVARRVEWAIGAGGTRSRRLGWIARKLSGLSGAIRDWDWLRGLADQLGQAAAVPWAITWIELSRGDGARAVKELVKYAVKDVEHGRPIAPSFMARVVVATKIRRLRWAASSLPAAERKEPPGDGCPCCHSSRIAPEPSRPRRRSTDESWHLVEQAMCGAGPPN